MKPMSRNELHHRRLVRRNQLQKDYELFGLAPLVVLSLSELVAIWRRTIEGMFDERDEEPDPRRKASLERTLHQILNSKEAKEMREIARSHLREQGVEVLQ